MNDGRESNVFPRTSGAVAEKDPYAKRPPKRVEIEILEDDRAFWACIDRSGRGSAIDLSDVDDGWVQNAIGRVPFESMELWSHPINQHRCLLRPIAGPWHDVHITAISVLVPGTLCLPLSHHRCTETTSSAIIPTKQQYLLILSCIVMYYRITIILVHMSSAPCLTA